MRNMRYHLIPLLNKLSFSLNKMRMKKRGNNKIKKIRYGKSLKGPISIGSNAAPKKPVIITM